MKKAVLLLVLVIFTLTSARTQVTDRWIPLDDLKSFINFIIDPVDTNVMYASHSYGICKSNNGGASWTDIYIYTSDHTGEIIQNPINRDTLYIGVIPMGTGGVGVYRSANRGNTWTQVYSDRSVTALALNPLSPHIIYAGTGYDSFYGDEVGILKSTTAGESWIPINTGLGSLEIYHLTINPLDTNILFAATEDGLYKTTDAGQNWQSSGSGLPGGAVINHITIDATDSNIVFAGTQGDGLYKSTDGGNNWSASSTGITNSIIYWITINPVQPNIIYAGVDEEGAFRSLDGGSTWSQMDLTGVTGVYETHTIRLNPLNPDIVYVLFGYGTTAVKIYKRLEDFAPPVIPTNLKGISNDRQVTLSWKWNTEPDLDKYNIYRDSVFLASITVTGTEDTIYTDTGLVNEKTYQYMVTALDEDGYESDYSEPLYIAPYRNPQGLIVYLPLEGHAIDESGNGNDGMAVDCFAAKNRYNDTNACYNFNGTSSFINCANFLMQNITEQITLMAWIYPRSASDTTYIISKSHFCENTGNYNLR